MAHQEFKTPHDALAHHGVKGMRWGVHKKEETGGSGGASRPKEAAADELSRAVDKVFSDHEALQAEGRAKLAAQAADPGFPKRDAKATKIEARAARFDKQAKDNAAARDAVTGNNLWNKYERSIYSDQVQANEKARDALLTKADQVRAGKLTKNQKWLIGIGAAAAVTGLAVYGNQKYQQNLAGINPKQARTENHRKTTEEWNSLFGEHHEFQSAVGYNTATGQSFFAGFASKKALSRPEFTIPEGTVFQRLTNHPEDSTEYGKKKGAYATFLNNDKKLYGASGEFGHKTHTVEFEANGPVKVPTINTILAHMKQIKGHEYPGASSDTVMEHMLYEYKQMSGGSWSDPTALKLFSSLKQFGYSAIVDDMDAGYMGDLPVVFFGDAKPASATPRTDIHRIRDSTGLLKISNKHA